MRTSKERIPCEMASRKISITMLYSTTLFIDGPRQMPPEDTS
jgi:hypothetical protein